MLLVLSLSRLLKNSPLKAPPILIDDTRNIEDNIHAVAKYSMLPRDNYFNDPEILPADKFDFVLAAYNAGPTKINRLRGTARRNPDR